MYVVGSYDASGNFLENGKTVDAQKLKDVRDDSSRTALSAVGWGVLYPDLLRTVPLMGSVSGALFDHDLDRGWALENQWIKSWKDPLWNKEPRISDWIGDTKRGTRPAVLFNVTVSETGQRLVVGSSLLPKAGGGAEWPTTAVQFADKYSNLDIHVATAARLSASFAWVSPMPRAEHDYLHFADGGYFDNSGLLSASDWLLAASQDIQGHPVLLIVIDASDTEPKAPVAWSWQRQLLGPISTLDSVRSGSQQSRSGFELPLLIDFLKQNKVDVTKYSFLYPKDRLAPLSWHLTPIQQRSIGEAWSNPSSDLAGDRAKLYKELSCQLSVK
jgi:hypothetical protein